MTQQVAVTIRIMDKEFQIGCPADEKDALLSSAQYLDSKMKEVRNSGVVGADKIAVLAALNITRELLSSQDDAKDYQALSAGLSDLSQRISATLSDINDR